MILDQQDPRAIASVGWLCLRRVMVRWRRRGLAHIFELNREGGAVALAIAFGGDRSTVHLDDGFGDRQAKSQPAELLGHARVALFEGVKDPRQKVGRDADTAVANL